MTTTARKLDESLIEYELTCEPEDMPIEGNAMASGDDEEDRKAEQWIKDQLDSGNEWAWCIAKVTARYPGLPFEGVDYLGACSYRSKEEFMAPGDYYDDMKREAKADLLRQIEEVRTVLCGEE